MAIIKNPITIVQVGSANAGAYELTTSKTVAKSHYQIDKQQNDNDNQNIENYNTEVIVEETN